MPSIFDTFAVLKPDLLLDTRRFGPDFYEQLEKDYAEPADFRFLPDAG